MQRVGGFAPLFHEAQGYYLSAAVSPSEFARLLELGIPAETQFADSRPRSRRTGAGRRG